MASILQAMSFRSVFKSAGRVHVEQSLDTGWALIVDCTVPKDSRSPSRRSDDDDKREKKPDDRAQTCIVYIVCQGTYNR